MKYLSKTVKRFFVGAILAFILSFSITGPVTAQGGADVNIGPLQLTDEEGGIRPDISGEQIESATCESRASLGWLLCPVAEGIYGMFEFLINDLIVGNLIEVDLDAGNGQYKLIWNSFRIIASFVFVIVFLILTYGQITGMSEVYNARKLLPRLTIAAIGMQLSFFLADWTVDFFNDLGRGIGSLVDSAGGAGPGEAAANFSWGGFFQGESGFFDWENGPNAVIGLFLGAIVGIGALLVFKALFLSGIIGALILIATLLFRNVLIVSLAVTSSIAWALYPLPNTEKYFKQWWDIFTKALAMYPIIIGLMAIGRLMGKVAVAGEDPSFPQGVLGFILTILPLFFVSAAYSLAGAGINLAANGLKGTVDKAMGDPKDQHSWNYRRKANAAAKRGRRWSNIASGKIRLPGFETEIGIPGPIRTPLARLASVSANAGNLRAGAEAKEKVDQITSGGDDDVIKAIAVTGGGRALGESIFRNGLGKTTAWEGTVKQGKVAYQNSAGNWMVRKAGESTATGKAAKEDDFYSLETLYAARALEGVHHEHIVGHAAGYALTKAGSREEEHQVYRGVHNISGTSSAKKGAWGTAWYTARESQPHLGNVDDDNLKTGRPGKYSRAVRSKINGRKNLEAFHNKLGQHDFVRLKQTAWKSIEESIDHINDTGSGYSQTDMKHLRGVLWNASGVVNSHKSGTPHRTVDADGNLVQNSIDSTSPATQSAATGARGVIDKMQREGIIDMLRQYSPDDALPNNI